MPPQSVATHLKNLQYVVQQYVAQQYVALDYVAQQYVNSNI